MTSPAPAGKLDQRLTIERRSITRGTFGEEVVTWSTLATVWAMVEDQLNVKKGGDEEVKDNMRVLASRTHFQIRYRGDVTTDDRIQWPARNRKFQITGIVEVGRRQALTLTCEQYSVPTP